MFIELVEFLRCPAEHPETHCVLATAVMVKRDVISGIVGCPACQREYPIQAGVARFGDPPQLGSAKRSLPGAATIQALLGVATPGGYVVLIGSAAALASDLAESMEGVHLVGINVPSDVRAGPNLSLLAAHSAVPLRSAMARGMVLGEELTSAPWTMEAARVLLPGLRLVAFTNELSLLGIDKLAAQEGIWVGQKEVRSEK
ncbi:MAG: hypothetical protein HY700_02520 [Gemmatimonadetes bacterium]|nr:hypothetical protein [Gemmatimonadota bacterium]